MLHKNISRFAIQFYQFYQLPLNNDQQRKYLTLPWKNCFTINTIFNIYSVSINSLVFFQDQILKDQLFDTFERFQILICSNGLVEAFRQCEFCT